MSLKMFHLGFVTAAILLALGCGAWSFHRYFAAGGGATGDLCFGLGSLVVAVGLVVYERLFIKKVKGIKDL